MIRVFVVVLVLAAVVAGCGGTAKVQAQSSRDRALLSSIVDRMKTDLVSVRMEPTSRVLPGESRHPGQTLVVKSAATTTADKLRDDWYTGLIGAAYNHQCAAKADHCLAWYAGPTSGERLNRRDALAPFARRRDLSREIRSAFASAGLRDTSVAFEHPYALAPVVTVRTRHPQQAVSAIREAEAGIPWRHIAGSFIQMLDAHGRLFFIDAGTWVLGEGWVRPGLRVPGQQEGVTGRNGPTAASRPQGPQGPTTLVAAHGGVAKWPKPSAGDRAILASVLHGMRGTLELVTTGSVSRKDRVRSARAEWDTLLIAHGFNDRCVPGVGQCVSVEIGPGGGARPVGAASSRHSGAEASWLGRSTAGSPPPSCRKSRSSSSTHGCSRRS